MHRLVALLTTCLTPLLLVTPTHTDSAPERWHWPTPHPVPVIRPFDPPPKPWMKGHRGVDLDLATGALILAPAPGRVVFAGLVAHTPVLSIAHGPIRSTYEPVHALVNVGEEVRTGQVIAVLLDGHTPSGLHWGAKLDRTHYINPLRMLIGPIGLKPWDTES